MMMMRKANKIDNVNTCLIDINELQSDTSPFIAAIESCQNLAARNSWSFYTKKPVSQELFEQSARNAIDNIAEDNPYLNVVEGEIDAIEAVRFKPGSYGLDIRPKVFDNKEKAWTLLDSGSCVSCVPKKPDDLIDPSFKLRAVNGNSIPTFGTEILSIRIGRKTYEIEAVKVDIPQRILGWDFFKKHSLGFEWGQFGDLFITDRKNGIKSLLKCFKLPSQDIQSVEFEDKYEEPLIQKPSNDAVLFETECMKQLDSDEPWVSAMSIHPEQTSPYCDNLPLSKSVDPDADQCEKENIKALQSIENSYKSLVEKYPNILILTINRTSYSYLNLNFCCKLENLHFGIVA